MAIQKVVEEMEREFDKDFTDHGRFWKDTTVYRDGGEEHINMIKDFMRSYTKKIVEAVGEEVITNARKWEKEANLENIENHVRIALYLKPPSEQKVTEKDVEQRTRLATIVKSLGEGK